LKALKSNTKCESYEPLKWQDSPFDHFGVLQKNVISIQPLQKVTKYIIRRVVAFEFMLTHASFVHYFDPKLY
jgi:hypothetical protein